MANVAKALFRLDIMFRCKKISLHSALLLH